jgi:hypothetical protein
MKGWVKLLAIAVISLATTGCSTLVWPDQPAEGGAEPAILVAGVDWGQTLVARESGLAAVDIYLAPNPLGLAPAPDSKVNLRLRSDPHTAIDIALASMPATSVTHPGFYQFHFAPQRDSQRHSYFLSIDLTGAGTVQVGDANPAAYEQGSLYRNGTPVDAQLAFRLGYDPGLVWYGVLSDGLTWSGWLGLAVLLFVVPGWALLAYLWPEKYALRWAERLGLAASLSLALYPLLFLWTGVMGLRLGPLYAWAPVLVAVAALAVRYWKSRTGWPISAPRAVVANWLRSSWLWPELAFVGVGGFVIFTRFWAARSIALPMWGDSYQHALISQLLVDHGGLFDSWQPYAGLQTLTYHFGFHAAVAVFHWLSQLPVPQAILWTGQLINGLSILAFYPVGARLGHTPWAGVLATLVIGLLSPLPMGYTNWGRYTQLAGQAILPAVICLAWLLYAQLDWDWRIAALAIVALGGLALTHYRILIVAVLFIFTLFFMHIRALLPSLKKVTALGLGAGILFLPWLWRLFDGRMMAFFTAQITTLPSSIAASAETNPPADPSIYPAWLYLLAFGCLAIGLWRRDRAVATVAAWWGLVVVATNPQWLGLPGQGVISNFAMFVAAFIPFGLIIGETLGRLIVRFVPLQGPILLGGVLLLGAWGARQRLADLDASRFGLATWADVRAADWIETHVPQNARFVINSFFAYSGHLAVGTDGGWWLPLLARRATDIPPLNYSLERGDHPDYVNWINALPRAIEQEGINDPSVLQLMSDRGIDYVYIGQKQGRVNYNGPDVLSPDTLLSSSSYRPIYHEDRVWIFEVVGNP